MDLVAGEESVSWEMSQNFSESLAHSVVKAVHGIKVAMHAVAVQAVAVHAETEEVQAVTVAVDTTVDTTVFTTVTRRTLLWLREDGRN